MKCKCIILAVALFFGIATNATATSEKTAKQRYYHANGIVKWIGKNARNTQYSSNPRKKAHWQKAVKFWISIRKQAWVEMHPKTRAPIYPPHHMLWMCIHSHEAQDWHNQDTGGNGHFGGLQMHPGWGYGTSYYASNDSQLTQEWAAENGYKASGFSRSWLLGQWAHYDCAAKYS